MPATRTFRYESVDADGRRTRGTVEAPSESAATQLLRQRGVMPLSLAATGKGLQREISIPGFGSRVGLKDLAVFARQFATMTASGMTLLRSLSILEEQSTKPALTKAIGEVRTDVAAGVSLSGAMSRHEKIFPPLMIAMVRAGEAGGLIDSALERIASTLEKDAVLRGKIKSAMTYPVIVLIFTLVLISAVLIFIVPVFEKMFAQLGGELPWVTQVIVTTSHHMVWFAPLATALTVGGTVLLRRQMRRRPQVRLAVDRFKLRMPVFGPLFKKIAISRFSRNLGTLLGVGVPVLQALDVVGATTGNAVITRAMQDVQASVRDGNSMSGPLREHPVFPHMVAQMVEVGEESGQISQMLDKIGDFYDREVDSAAESLTASIEPIMVLVMGGVVGAMVVCLYLPMFTIYQNIGGQ